MKHTTLISIILTLVLNACSYRDMKGINAPAGEALDGGDFGLDFATISEQILDNPDTGKCTQCHSWAFVHSEVLRLKDQIRDRVNRALGSPGAMPKDNPPLTPELKAMLFAWLDAGAPEFSTLDVQKQSQDQLQEP